VEDNILHTKALILGITTLFMLTILSPLSGGWGVKDDETYLENLYLASYNPLIDHTRKHVDYTRTNQRNIAVNELNSYVQVLSNNPLGGPIDSAWPMQSQNQNHTGLSSYNTASNPGIEKWRYKAEGKIDGGIAIDVDGTLYFGDFHGDITALNPDGSLKWKHNINNIILTSCPCIGKDGTIYVSTFGNRLYAMNPDGSLKWRVSVGGEAGGSPAVADDGTIYVGVMGPGSDKGSVAAINPNGTIKWIYEVDYFVAAHVTIHPDGTIIFGSMDEYIYALHPNGTLRWRYKTDHVIRGHASLDDNGIIYYSCWDGYLYAFNVDGTLVKKFDMPIPGGETMAFGPDGTIYVTYDGLAAIDPNTWTVKWKFDYPGLDEIAYLSSPAVSADGIIYIGVDVEDTPLGAIYAINSDGTLRWRKYIANQGLVSSPSISSDGTVYIGSWWGSPSGSFGCIHAFNDAISNHPPSKPLLDGDSTIEIGHKYRPQIYAEDLDNQPIKFLIDWGDSQTEETIIWYTSGVWHDDAWHEYLRLGEKTIRVKSIGIFGEESDWAYLTIEVPYSYQYPGWQWLYERFPILSTILNQFIGPLD
jgi:outer membrane protein assembly factor BamB